MALEMGPHRAVTPHRDEAVCQGSTVRWPRALACREDVEIPHLGLETDERAMNMQLPGVEPGPPSAPAIFAD